MNTLNSLPGLPALGYPSWQAPPGLPIFAQPKWIAVRRRFELFHSNLSLTMLQQQDAHTKRAGVVSCLNRWYYGTSSTTDNNFAIGSWGKDTAIRPPRDVDLYFLLPLNAYHRFQDYIGNRQSALLQEIKDVLGNTYPDTDMRGDGQVAMVRFDTLNVEVAPAFLLGNGRYWICNTRDGGSYKETDPWAELRYLEEADQANSRNLRPLIRMLKVWQEYCAVPIKSFQLELLAADFLNRSLWRHKDFFWFDWIARDFFAYLYHCVNKFVAVAGTMELIFLGNKWQSRAATAYWRAEKACRFDECNLVEAAGEEWQKIFGTLIPRIA